ncbi:hypothetical protein BpHYR1_038378 [Brachionus plicatilis]|uniref:Uncharacterized protein n=1 Tax=Brachionus plicatilis TaxID=10195 RepID=A0A3M7R1A1_BRAPC|nr:hypothetical protein BpHYR1_038378 [Brachionus plicatilis]
MPQTIFFFKYSYKYECADLEFMCLSSRVSGHSKLKIMPLLTRVVQKSNKTLQIIEYVSLTRSSLLLRTSKLTIFSDFSPLWPKQS